jgi:integrase
MAWVERRGDGFRVRYRLADGTLFTENGFATRELAEGRALDVESDQRRRQFTDPRLARTTVDEWVRQWSDAHRVGDVTWATYSSHINNHILPRWTGSALGDVVRIGVKGWVNRDLRPRMADRSAQDVLVVFSMIMAEAVDEGLIGTNPCRKLRINFTEASERSPATADEVDAICWRMPPDEALLVEMDAYTGLRWGEIAALQWSRTFLSGPRPHVKVDPLVGALHEHGGLVLGPPKTPASVRTVYLPPFLADELKAKRAREPAARFVFTGALGGFYRRSNFRRRFWVPALAGDPERGWGPVQVGMHFHDLRHTHETWLVEDRVPRVLRLQQVGHKRKDIDDHYSHVTDRMVDGMIAQLRARWEQDGGWTWAESRVVATKTG